MDENASTAAGGDPEFFVPDDLSGLLDGTDDLTTLTPSRSGMVTVVGDVGVLDGMPYVCTVQATDDVTIPLARGQAIAYAWTVVQAAHRAHYMAAVFAQLKTVMGTRDLPDGESPESLARLALREVLKDLPDLDDSVTAPLTFQPVITREGLARVRVLVAGQAEALTGWSFNEALSHATGVLSVAAVCDLDTVYRTVLARAFGLGEGSARAAVCDLGNFYPADPEDPAASPLAQRPAEPVRRVAPPPPGARPAGGKSRKRGRR